MPSKTINVIAQLAGVSRSTVSRVLNDSPSVNKETREKVQRIIEEQGYRPNQFARTLSSTQISTLGVVIPAIQDPFCSLLVSGAEDACTALGASLILRESRRTEEGEKRAIEELLGLGCDNLVLYVQQISDDDLLRYSRRQPKIIVLDRHLEGAQEKCLWVDHFLGGAGAADILINRGVKNIAALLSHSEESSQSQRWNGALAEFSEAGITPNSEQVIRTGNDIQDGRVAMRKLLALGLNIDGLFCDNDALAIGALQTLQENGLSVPNDIAVVGYDDLEFSAFCVPSLTTIKVPIYDLARRAAEGLLQQSNAQIGAMKEENPNNKTVPTAIRRESA